MQSRYEAGVLGRKTKNGFYKYDAEMKPIVPPEAPAPAARPESVWISTADARGHAALTELLGKLGATVESGAKPSAKALCLVTPIGEDATTCAVEQGLDPKRTVAVDTLFPMVKRRTIMTTPITDPAYRDAAHGLLASDGVPVTVCHDSPGFIAQRIVAMIVNIGCSIAQSRTAVAGRHRQGGDAGPELSERARSVSPTRWASTASTRCCRRCTASTAIRATVRTSG